MKTHDAEAMPLIYLYSVFPCLSEGFYASNLYGGLQPYLKLVSVLIFSFFFRGLAAQDTNVLYAWAAFLRKYVNIDK